MARLLGRGGAIAPLVLWFVFSLGLVAVGAQTTKPATDLYDRPVIAVDPGMHSATVWSQAVDGLGRFVVTGSADRTIKIWSVADGKLQKTIWIPVGSGRTGLIYAVAISPDGSTIAAGGVTERDKFGHAIYIFDRESGGLVRTIREELPDVINSLVFSPDGRYLAGIFYSGGLRVFDRTQSWNEIFSDDRYESVSNGLAFSQTGKLATTSTDGFIRLYGYNRSAANPNFHRIGEPKPSPSGRNPFGVAFNPDGESLAITYIDIAAVDILDVKTLRRIGGKQPTDMTPDPDGFAAVAWSRNGQTLYAAGGATDVQKRRWLFAWDGKGFRTEHRIAYCGGDAAKNISPLPDGQIVMGSMHPCLNLLDNHGKPTWTVATNILNFTNGKAKLLVSRDGKVVDFTDGEFNRRCVTI